VSRWHVNGTLVLGGSIVGALIVLALAAPLLTSFDPTEPVVRFNGGDLVQAPYPPGTQGMLLGSDTVRRDLWTRLLYGTRFTLLLCLLAAAARLLIGAVLGIIAGWFPRTDPAISALISAWSAIPALILAVVPIAIVNASRNLFASLITFLIVLSITGWAEIAVRCRLAVQQIRTTPYIEAAYALGLPEHRVIGWHVLPNLRPLLLADAAAATGAVLLLVAELGFLNLFLGGAEVDSIGSRITVDAITSEWGGLLANGLRNRSGAPWLLIAPTVAFTLAILGFNTLADGLRRRR
jgi:peptide/nickel transport system permease protein